ncbi:MAG: cupin domain-containing protein [Candidatus Bathyarchaeota archaeon]|nr:cupin domain-containing protein [Candidatus Bathyarchaeota archaeon]
MEIQTLVKAFENNIIKTFNYHSIFHDINGEKMQQPKIIKKITPKEYFTSERCYVAENYSTETVSIARATVKPGVTTKAHHLKNSVQEIYIITSGKGKVQIGNLEPTEVSPGDVVVIPANTSQKISNIGKSDLVFYCVCTPRFTEECYIDEEPEEP